MKIEVPSSGPAQGAAEVHRYGLNPSDFAIIQKMLSRGLYSDPIRAAIQELGSNARDAQIENGNPEVPIEITLPVEDDPTLYIVDHGVGISEYRMVNIFGKLAASTKRDDDTQLGGFGLGSKTGFAISDTFTIDTVAVDLDGVRRKRTWLHYKEAGLNSFTEFSSENTDEPTGTIIKIPIPDWEEKFEHMWRSAFSIFRYWDVKPIIRNAPDNAQWEVLETSYQGEGWRLERKSGQDDKSDTSGVTIIVGGIPYDLDSNQLSRIGIKYSGYYRLVFSFEIGEIEVLPTRESIDYEASTPALISRYRSYCEEIEAVINARQDEELIPALRVAKGIGLDSITWRGRVVDVKSLGDVWINKWNFPQVKAYNIHIDEDGFEKEKTETVRFTRVYYVITKSPSKHRVDFAFKQADNNRHCLICFGSQYAFDEFTRLYPAFTEMAALLPLAPPQKRKPADVNQVYIFNGNRKPTKTTVDVSKLKGFYGFVVGNQLVDERGNRILKDQKETVYGLRAWWKKNKDQLPKSAVPYSHVITVRSKRKKMRFDCSQSPVYRKHRFLLRLGDNRKERCQILTLLKLPAFCLIRDRIKKLDAHYNNEHAHLAYVELDDLVELAFKGHIPSFLTGTCDFGDTQLFLTFLKKLKYNTVTWDDFKKHRHLSIIK